MFSTEFYLKRDPISGRISAETEEILDLKNQNCSFLSILSVRSVRKPSFGRSIDRFQLLEQLSFAVADHDVIGP